MTSLPDESTIAQMVSNLSQRMFGVTFSRCDGSSRGESLCSRMVRLRLRGGSGIEVVLAFDTTSSRALTAAFHSWPEGWLNDAMIEHATGELVKLVASQVQSALHIYKPLGTPQRTTLAEMAATLGPGWNEALLLRSEGLGDLRLWVLAGPASRLAEAAGPLGYRQRLRTFIGTLLPF
jgi:hypothetical protein